MRFATTLSLPFILLALVMSTSASSPASSTTGILGGLNPFRRWVSGFAAEHQDATSMRVRRHGPRRRSVHP
ncbi:hypothetical protein C8J57DRAFT_1359237 [Mycena rebaudengoi]|nr:hypothetical protein C8J57DRAFT_1359237 [Mycena rebaudengoi]